jgi:predicted nuclease of predicted toxin-antitoxin system
MGVSVKVVLWLRERGHDAIHLRDEGLQRLPDREIFGKAVAENRAILTFDLDFGEIAALSEGEKCSVVVFRLGNTRTPHVIARLDLVLNASSYLEKGAVVIIEETQHRIRRLPVGEG